MRTKEIIKIDIKELKKAYSKSEWPCLDYCKELLSTGHKKNIRLEVWNYDREVPESDWTVENIGEYYEKGKILKKRGCS